MVNTNPPLLTLVVKTIDERDKLDKLNEAGKDLMGTLSSLCSFYTVDDFGSFVYSKNFQNLLREKGWVRFELGVYSDHEKVIEMSANLMEVILFDVLELGVFGENVVSCSERVALENNLKKWLEFVLVK